MKSGKRLFISLMINAIAVLSIWFMVLDFSRFYNSDFSYDIFPSAVLKRICVLIAASVAWSVGRDGLNPTDSRQMKAALFFAVAGEAAFALGERTIGICMFSVCHSLLLIRNAKGLRRRLLQAGSRKQLFLLAILAMTVVLWLSFMGQFSSFTEQNALSASAIIYSIILSASLWAAIACFVLRLLPPINSRLAAAGVFCFFCCDVLVGLDAVLEPGIPWLLANSFIWIFYIPALTLLALSSYKY